MDKQIAIDIIRELLIELDLNASQLAEKVGVSSQTIYEITNPSKSNTISKKLAYKIVDTFPEINIAYLLDRKSVV